MSAADTGVALVTGASRGLGAALATALGAAGWAVAVNFAHDETGARGVATAIREAGGRAEPMRFDVTDEVAVQEGIARIARALGPVDLVVNNATGPQPMMPIAEQSWDDHLDQLRFFVKAPLILLKTVLPEWRTRPGTGRRPGRVINIGSEVVDIGNADFGHYVAAKAAMVGLTRSWASELGPEGITVNLVAPGFIPVERHAAVPSEAVEAYRGAVPLGRMGRPGDLGGMVVFLASPAADFITGQTVAVNGGRTLA